MQNRSWVLIAGAILLILVGLGAGIVVTSFLLNGEDDSSTAAEENLAADEIAGTDIEGETAAGDGSLPVPPTLEISPTPSNTPTQTPIPSDTPPPTDTPIATATFTPTPTATPTETPTQTPTATRTGPQARANEDAGFFAGPGTSFGRLAYFAKPDEQVVILGKSEGDQWWHVVSNANSFEGWVSARFFSLTSGDLESVAVSDFRKTPVVTAVVSNPSGSDDDDAPPTDAVAYWAFLDASARGNEGDGTWSGELLVRVPTGNFDYRFELGDVVQGWERIVVNEGEFDNYLVYLSGMGCGSFVRDMFAYQNGSQW